MKFVQPCWVLVLPSSTNFPIYKLSLFLDLILEILAVDIENNNNNIQCCAKQKQQIAKQNIFSNILLFPPTHQYISIRTLL